MKLIQKIKRGIANEKRKYPGNPVFVLVLRKSFEIIRDRVRFISMLSKKDSTFETEDTMFMCSLFPGRILDLIIRDIKPSSVLDVGCGTGVSLSYFLEHGVDAKGVENSLMAIEKSPVKEKIIRHNLNEPLNLNMKFDLVWCFEVIEHIHPVYEESILQTLVNHSDTVMLSAARPGQGGHGHFNEQEPAYWINKFDKKGFDFDVVLTDQIKATKETFAENFLVFKRRGAAGNMNVI